MTARAKSQSKLPINLEDLLRQRHVEGERIEYKAGWNPDATTRTLCAFANDFENLGGGYIVIGQDCDDSGTPIFPPVGVPEILGQDPTRAANFLQPDPTALFPPPESKASKARRYLFSGLPAARTEPTNRPSLSLPKRKTTDTIFAVTPAPWRPKTKTSASLSV